MLGCWLAMSPFIFRHAADERVRWFNDLLSALAVVVLALVSFSPQLRYVHLGIVVVALWLIGFRILGIRLPRAASAAERYPGGIVATDVRHHSQ
jgi:hypothetical protein